MYYCNFVRLGVSVRYPLLCMIVENHFLSFHVIVVPPYNTVIIPFL